MRFYTIAAILAAGLAAAAPVSDTATAKAPAQEKRVRIEHLPSHAKP